MKLADAAEFCDQGADENTDRRGSCSSRKNVAESDPSLAKKVAIRARRWQLVCLCVSVGVCLSARA